ncbi:MAG: CDP-diacylglycerol--serine O-phosphatidyltransferase [Opitutales bacterium]|nr:CDP-diacylglycerol--serine O-phosphatidyltransferase [Opitutales bacterium]
METPEKPLYSDAREASHIYFLPNLMTAGNLFCGYVAVIRCIQAKFTATADEAAVALDTIARTPQEYYEQAVWFILAAVVFDILDGRMARLTRKESLFGKEFDSIADIVSFGMAPALLVFFLLLSPTAEFPLVRTLGGLVGFFYLLCAAVRLARYNVLTSPLLKPAAGIPKYDFMGLPVPAAAGMISSLVMVINRTESQVFTLFLPVILILIAVLMVSPVRYPSLKTIGFRTRMGFRSFILIAVVIVVVFMFHYWAIAAVFAAYVLYGLAAHVFPGRLPDLFFPPTKTFPQEPANDSGGDGEQSVDK